MVYSFSSVSFSLQLLNSLPVDCRILMASIWEAVHSKAFEDFELGNSANAN